MKKRTVYKTARREIFAPDTAVGFGLVNIARDLKARADTAKYTLINENSPKDGFAHLCGACFANWSAETGDFERKQILKE